MKACVCAFFYRADVNQSGHGEPSLCTPKKELDFINLVAKLLLFVFFFWGGGDPFYQSLGLYFKLVCF